MRVTSWSSQASELFQLRQRDSGSNSPEVLLASLENGTIEAWLFDKDLKDFITFFNDGPCKLSKACGNPINYPILFDDFVNKIS